MLRQTGNFPQSGKLPAQCTACGKGFCRLACSEAAAIDALDLTGQGGWCTWFGDLPRTSQDVISASPLTIIRQP